MDQIIKLESSSELLCIACARCDIQTFGEHEMNLEILSIFKELLKDYIQNLNGTPIVLCVGCMEILSTINDFKNKCIQTFLQLSNGVSSIMVDNLTDNFYPEVKLEETFTSEIDLIKHESQPKKIAKTTEKVFKKQNNKSKPALKEKGTKTESVPTFEKRTDYCNICCSNQINVYGHYLDVHSRQLEDGTLTCILCDESCIDVYLLESHIESKHKEFNHTRKCGRCEVEIKNRKDFVEHVHMTHFKERKKIIPCDFCDSVYYKSYTYKNHIRTHVGAIRCKFCEQSFFDELVLAEHLKTHENSKRLQKSIMVCDFCGYTAKHRNNLIEHIFSYHVKGLEVKCELCGKEFKTKAKLKTHITSTHDPKTKPCHHCGKKFRTNTHLRHHIRRVHMVGPAVKVKKIEVLKDRKFECDLCDKKFYKKHSLQKHKYSHSKTRPYNCHMCSTGYYMNAYLRGHYLREHGVNYTPKEIRDICGFGKAYGQSDSE